MTQADSVHSTPPLNTSSDTPASDSRSPQDSLFLPTDITPEQLFRAIGKLRRDARDEIDRLIRFLDSTENHMAIDCEPEDEGDDADAEPSLGFLEPVTIGGDWLGRTPWQSKSFNQDRPQGSNVADPEGDDCDDEPSLGSLERQEWGDQERWACSGMRDMEDEHDGAEPDGDGEPSLGWTVCGVLGDINDRELDDCDRESNEPVLTECA